MKMKKGGSLTEGLSEQYPCEQKVPTKETKVNQRPLPNTESASSDKQPGKFTIK